MSIRTRWILVFFLIGLSGCASSPKDASPDAPLTDAFRAELEKYCAKGNPFSCYRIGSDLDDKKNWGEAKVWFKKACDLKLPASCSEASVMAKSHLNEREEAMKLARQACEMNDTLGCYNQGCYQCVYHNDPAAAFKSLELAVKLGYRNRKSLEDDPDLECVRKTKQWKAFMKSIPEEGDSKTTHRYALSTGIRHLYHPKLRFSYAAVPGFHIQSSVSGVLIFDDAGSRIFITGSSQPFSDVSEVIKREEMISTGETEIHTEQGTVNGYQSYVRVVKGTAQGMEYVASIYVTGDEKYTVTAQATYLASYHSTYGPAILQSAESIVLDPRGPPGVSELPYTNAAQIGAYKYAGIQRGGPLWTPSGRLPGRGDKRASLDTLVVNSFVFSKNEPFSEKTFEKVWNLVTGQSSIQVAKLDLKKVKRSKTPEGNRAFHYLSEAEQKDREGNSYPIRLEVGLVKFPYSFAMGEPGYFWARVIHRPRPSLEEDTAALIRLKLRPSAIEELKEATAEEPEVTAPGTTGNGAIPAS